MTTSHPTSEALARLPHQPPFRFITRLLELEPGSRAVGEWEVSPDADFFRGHFPGDPIVPGVLITEALAQLAGIVAFAHSSAATPARLARIDVKLLAAVRPPATIALSARHTGALGQLHQLDVTAHVAGEVIAKGSITLAAASHREGSRT